MKFVKRHILISCNYLVSLVISKGCVRHKPASILISSRMRADSEKLRRVVRAEMTLINVLVNTALRMLIWSTYPGIGKHDTPIFSKGEHHHTASGAALFCEQIQTVLKMIIQTSVPASCDTKMTNDHTRLCNANDLIEGAADAMASKRL